MAHFTEIMQIFISFVFIVCFLVLYCKTLKESEKIEKSKLDLLNSIESKVDLIIISNKNKESKND